MHKHIFFLLVFFSALSGCKKQADEPSNKLPASHETQDVAANSNEVQAYLPLPEGPDFRSIERRLRQRAAKGDPLAACQLATELEFCAAATTSEQLARASGNTYAVERASRAPQPPQAATLAGITASRMAYCKGATVDSAADRIALWERAAQLGHLPSVLRYTSGRAFPRQDILGLLPQLKAYKANALPMLEKAAKEGSVQANVILAKAYSQLGQYGFSSNLPAQLIQAKSPARSLAYLLMAQKLLETPGLDDGQLVDEVNFLIAEARRQHPAPDPSEVNLDYQKLISSNTGRGRSLVVPAEQDSELALFSTTPARNLCGESVFIR